MRRGRSAFWLPILLCWLAYSSAYLGRYSYSANINSIISLYGLNHRSVGLVTTCFFFAYGTGQVVHGLLCRFYPKRWVVPGALLVSAGLNLGIFFGLPFECYPCLWLINGAVQSILWPSIIAILSETLASDDLAKSVVVMGSVTAAGTLAVYGCAALFVWMGCFQFSFLAAAVTMSAIAVWWMLAYPSAFPVRQRQVGAKKQIRKSKNLSLLGTLVLLGIFAVACNLVKDGLGTWVPAILKEQFGLGDSLSILLTLVLPILGIWGSAANTWMEKRIPSFVSLSGLWYLASALFIGIVIAVEQTQAWQIVLVSFGVISLLTHGINSLITGMAPLYLRDRVHSGTVAGLLNGCCYIGSTISAYGLGDIADRWGWSGVFRLLLGACCFCVILSVFHTLIEGKRRHIDERSE